MHPTLSIATVFAMARPIAILQEEIRRLSAAEKEEVLRTLLEELDGPPDPDVESAWLKEVERRAAELDSGQVQCVPADEVFRQLDTLLKK
ncbi:MAG: addiction module protein [Gammaproteobacteria bacterium]|nr:addiction module protein [Gammaproteobacteria bacterium]